MILDVYMGSKYAYRKRLWVIRGGRVAGGEGKDILRKYITEKQLV